MSMIHEAIVKVMGSIGAIEKSRRNQQQNYQFRGIDDVYAAFQSHLSEAGIFSVPQVMDMRREERQTKLGGILIYTMLTVKYTFFSHDGSSIECIVVGEGMDSGDKSANKAMSAAQKYAFLQIFCVPTEEPKDSENDSPKPLPKPHGKQPEAKEGEAPVMSEAQRKKLWALMKQAGLSSEDCKDQFAFVNPKTSTAASQFIEQFDVLKADWEEAR